MYDVFLRNIHIGKVRHLCDIDIPITDAERKHLIITGKNGSGKTSLLDALSHQLGYLSTIGDFPGIDRAIKIYSTNINNMVRNGDTEESIGQERQKKENLEKRLEDAKAGLDLTFNVPYEGLKLHFPQGDFVLAYYKANRVFDAIIPKHVEKVELKDNYDISESPRNEFVKYILDLKMTEALAQTSGKKERAEAISAWFLNFEALLKAIFEDDSIQLLFDEETFTFSIHQDGKEPFDFKGLSDGFAAILDIVVDLMVRMQKHLNGGLSFNLPGIVLIDEIETHLHLELQRKVMNFLTSVFPNIQFIVTTHSAFILSSVSNATIYDLENKTCVHSGLTDLPYDGIIKGYFEVDVLSRELREKFDRYKELVTKKNLSDNELEEIAEIEFYLNEIPDYLAIDITAEYKRLKADFDQREDL